MGICMLRILCSSKHFCSVTKNFSLKGTVPRYKGCVLLFLKTFENQS